MFLGSTGGALLWNLRCAGLLLVLTLGTGAALHPRHKFGILWEGWSTNSTAASDIPGLSGCVNREGGVCTSEYICGVGGYRLGCERAAERMFYCCCHNYIWKARKKTQPTHCSGQAKRTSAEFYFPIAKAWLDCFGSKKQSQALCVWWMADGPEMRGLLSLRLICCHHEVRGYLEESFFGGIWEHYMPEAGVPFSRKG